MGAAEWGGDFVSMHNELHTHTHIHTHTATRIINSLMTSS